MNMFALKSGYVNKKRVKCLVVCLFLITVTFAQQQTSPIVIVNGDAGSQLQVKLNKTTSVHLWCEKHCDWSTIWLSVEDLTAPLIDCFTDNMRLVFNNVTNTFSNVEGVQIRVPYFGNTTGIEYLDPSTSYVGEYFGSFVQAFVKNGYKRNINIRAAPYDFRSAPDTSGVYFTKLKNLIEETYTMNNKTPVALVCHSLGCPYSSLFLNNVSQNWKDKYLHVLITISAAWGGSAKVMGLYASGYGIGIPRVLVNPVKLRPFQRSLKSSSFLLPSKSFWDYSHPFIQTPIRKYTINDFDDFFRDIGFPEGIAIRKTVPPVFSEQPPNVPVICLHGSGVKTPQTYTYTNKTFPDGPPDIVYGDGDGTVSNFSLRGCLQWRGRQKHPVIIKDFDKAEHNGILQNMDLIQFVKHFLLFDSF